MTALIRDVPTGRPCSVKAEGKRGGKKRAKYKKIYYILFYKSKSVQERSALCRFPPHRLSQSDIHHGCRPRLPPNTLSKTKSAFHATSFILRPSQGSRRKEGRPPTTTEEGSEGSEETARTFAVSAPGTPRVGTFFRLMRYTALYLPDTQKLNKKKINCSRSDCTEVCLCFYGADKHPLFVCHRLFTN